MVTGVNSRTDPAGSDNTIPDMTNGPDTGSVPMTGPLRTRALTPKARLWIEAQLAKAPPLTEDRVRALLAASGVRPTPRRP